MKKCLICVGTSSFNSLLIQIDSLKRNDVYFEIQYGNSSYIPKHHKSYRWLDNFIEYAASFDFVITHAGAGTIYGLLEKNVKLLVVPNIERVDKHQLEISRFLLENNLAYICYDINDLNGRINDILRSDSNIDSYSKEDFFLIDLISDIVNR